MTVIALELKYAITKIAQLLDCGANGQYAVLIVIVVHRLDTENVSLERLVMKVVMDQPWT